MNRLFHLQECENEEDILIELIDLKKQYSPKEIRYSADTFRVQDRVVINIPDHELYLKIGTVCGMVKDSMVVSMDNPKLIIKVCPEGLIPYKEELQ